MAFEGDGVGFFIFSPFLADDEFTVRMPPFQLTADTRGLLRHSAQISSLFTIAGGIKFRASSSVDIDLMLPALGVGDYVTDLVISRAAGNPLITVSAMGQTATGSSNASILFNRILGLSGSSTNYNAIIDGGLLEISGGNVNQEAAFDFRLESGSTLPDTLGNKADATMSEFTTGAFIANIAVTPETATITFDIPAGISGKSGMRYALMNNSLTTVLKSGTLNTSAATVTIDVTGLGLADGQVLQLYATDKTSSNPTTAVTAWDESTASITGG